MRRPARAVSKQCSQAVIVHVKKKIWGTVANAKRLASRRNKKEDAKQAERKR